MPRNPEQTLSDEPPSSAFFEFVQEALGLHGVAASPEAEHYLVSLLGAFVRTKPDRLSRALGPELVSASRLDPVSRSIKLKDLGDTTLFLAGVFLDHIESRPAATEYYFTIGRTAYGRLADLAKLRATGLSGQAETFAELSERFVEFVRVLSSVADRELFSSTEHLVGIYNRWLATGNPRDAARLVARGMIPSSEGGSSH
jgi:hypothetical protein